MGLTSKGAEELWHLLVEIKDLTGGSLSRKEIETLAARILDVEWERQVRPIEILYYSHEITKEERDFLIRGVIEKYVGRGLRPPAAVNDCPSHVLSLERQRELVQLVQQVEQRPSERAQRLVYDYVRAALQGTRIGAEAAVQVARQALNISSECADAYLMLAAAAGSAKEAVSWSEKALQAAEKLLGQELIEKSAGLFLSLVLTRPYLRARNQLARALWNAGRKSEAIQHAEAILALNPSDILGVRFYLLNWYLEMQMTEKAGELFDNYHLNEKGPDSDRTSVVYDRALLLFQKEGDSPPARQALDYAVFRNPYVIGAITRALLASAIAGPDSDEFMLPVRELERLAEHDDRVGKLAFEAAEYFRERLEAWMQTPGAMEWIGESGMKLLLSAVGGSGRTAGKRGKQVPVVAPELIYQLKITLSGSKPPIWRRVLVPASATFYDLNEIILESMGWLGGHLWEFEVGDHLYGPRGPDLDWGDEPPQDARKTRLYEVLGGPGTTFRHFYDFGDGWVHNVRVEKLLEPEPGVTYPRCVAGKRACPPEDCGGIWRYYELLKIAADPSHPDHKETVAWLGPERLDPEKFDVVEADAALEYVRRRLSRRQLRAKKRG